MFGNKLRSWMEAVRPRKKQHRKVKQSKSNSTSAPMSNVEWQTPVKDKKFKNYGRADEKRENQVKQLPPDVTPNQCGPSGISNSINSHSRYSAANLSSPESAYSTGYSTDGTSPGAGIPPEYLQMNCARTTDIRCYQNEPVPVSNRVSHDKPNQAERAAPGPVPSSARVTRVMVTSSTLASTSVLPKPNLAPNHVSERRNSCLATQESEETRVLAAQARSAILHGGSPALGLTSPRQRNRIRTNPWLPGGVTSPVHGRQECQKTLVSTVRTPVKDNRLRQFLSPALVRRSLSSSSCSSLSGTSLYWEPTRPKSASDDDDCTLNEMMGKYDESYVYEKETDILSDSDPTDCETDVDTGQDGGDEDELPETELDFIDNGSYLDFDPRSDLNTGHCSYYSFDTQRKCSSKRRATRRNKQPSDKRRRSTSNKKRHKQSERLKSNSPLDGSRSAGATPISVRRANHRPISKLALDDCLKKRSNSVCLSRSPISTIDKRDKEADRKYKELIVEAEYILRNMKCTGLSPRRVPGPTNKRVELLRNTECAKQDHFVKARTMVDDNPANGNVFSKIPSTNFNCSRFSPKKNHITNFIINNSPIMVKRERDMHVQGYVSVLPSQNSKKIDTDELQSKNVVAKEKNLEITTRRSPKYRKKAIKHQNRRSSSSSESESDRINQTGCRTKSVAFSCPQSEPVRRKVYFQNKNTYYQDCIKQERVATTQRHGKTVAFSLHHENYNNASFLENQEYHTISTENLRQQVLMHTLVNLKRNLEDQSASLKQVYRSSQDVTV